MNQLGYTVVIPTIGRPCLQTAVDSIAAAAGPAPTEVLIVDDLGRGIDLDRPAPLADRIRVLPGPGRGPAAARNVGWHAARTEWVAFLDDDVEVTAGWCADLAADLQGADVAGSQGRLVVPLPRHRRPTDWERATAGLADARWATADMAYRRSVLAELSGFDERFPRAYREDADLALRVLSAGHRLTVGRRRTVHPVRTAPWWISLRTQAGNADDPLMRRLHGADWRRRAGVPRGRRPRHLATTAAAAAALAATAARRPRLALVLAAGWAAGTAELATARILPGPRTSGEIAAMAATSVAMPPLATAHWLRGLLSARGAHPLTRDSRRNVAPDNAGPLDAVLFDRDGTLVHDVPYNGDPARVRPMPGAGSALELLRSRGVRLGVISNQSGIARGLISGAEVQRVNDRIEELLGPFDVWQVCPHGADAGCPCRKPAPGMVIAAARALDTVPARVAVIGDIGSDIAAAHAAGARAVLVPTAATRPEEIDNSPLTAPDLLSAIRLLLDGTRLGHCAGDGRNGSSDRTLPRAGAPR